MKALRQDVYVRLRKWHHKGVFGHGHTTAYGHGKESAFLDSRVRLSVFLWLDEKFVVLSCISGQRERCFMLKYDKSK
jgi:hypothetical protein